MSEKEAHGQGFGDGISVCEKDIEELNRQLSALRTANERLTRELETRNEQLVKRTVDHAATIARLTKAEEKLAHVKELWMTRGIDYDRELACLDFGSAHKLEDTLQPVQEKGEGK